MNANKPDEQESTNLFRHNRFKRLQGLLYVTCFLILINSHAQSQTISLKDLSSFREAGSWQMVGDIKADLEKDNKFEVKAGNEILVNLPTKKSPGKDLFSKIEHGNVDIELDYMMAKGSNSGIYLQGLYEFQLMDSWGTKELLPGQNGGIYQRWDDTKPEGQKGYEGYAPRQQVGKAPGLWQHLKISFQAPTFDAQGKKMENARILKAELNGVVIHENVELFGPTRGAISDQEKALGPLRIQGDHGPVAFRNIKITPFDNPKPELKNLKYTIYGGKYEKEPLYDSLPPEAEGTSTILTSNLKVKSNRFLIKYTGTLDIKKEGKYQFKMSTVGGTGGLRINKQEVIPINNHYYGGYGEIELPVGELPFELFYTKFVDWDDPALGLFITGPGIREYLISDIEEMQQSVAVDPILVTANDIPVLRSFMDIPSGVRVTHAISVGSNDGLHFTYDLGHGSLVQLWRGGFIDATPMWHSRGDGSSKPQGSVEYLMEKPELSILNLKNENESWAQDTIGSLFKPKGYTLDTEGKPVFQYQLYGASVKDAISVVENGKAIERTIKVDNAGKQLYFRLAKGSKIEEIGKGLYVIGDKSYYLRLQDSGAVKPRIRNGKEGQELIIPIQNTLSYSILL